MTAVEAIFLRYLTCFIWLLCLNSHAYADIRKALVIGNSGYEHSSQLPNTLNDSKDVAEALTRIGFSVDLKIDLPFDSMRRALRDFAQNSGDADMALIYYAGHGMELGGQNYLLPVDAKLQSDRDVAFETIPLSQMLEAVGGAKTLRLVLLDACRNNPFLAKMNVKTKSRSVANGLARIEPSGALVSYAAKEGTTAADGFGRNSPYAEALIKHMQEPGLEIRLLFGKVRDTVVEKTGNSQEPFTYGSLGGNAIYLVPPVETKATPSAELDFTVDKPIVKASLQAEYDRTQFFVEKRTGLFFARKTGVVLRKSPSVLAGGVTTLSENTGYTVRERLIAKLDERPWYSLETSSGLGFAPADEVFSETTFREKRSYEKAKDELNLTWDKAKSENEGKLAKYWGIYSQKNSSCIGGAQLRNGSFGSKRIR